MERRVFYRKGWMQVLSVSIWVGCTIFACWCIVLWFVEKPPIVFDGSYFFKLVLAIIAFFFCFINLLSCVNPLKNKALTPRRNGLGVFRLRKEAGRKREKRRLIIMLL